MKPANHENISWSNPIHFETDDEWANFNHKMKAERKMFWGWCLLDGAEIINVTLWQYDLSGMTQHLDPCELRDDNYYIEILTTKFEATKEMYWVKQISWFIIIKKIRVFNKSKTSLISSISVLWQVFTRMWRTIAIWKYHTHAHFKYKTLFLGN